MKYHWTVTVTHTHRSQPDTSTSFTCTKTYPEMHQWINGQIAENIRIRGVRGVAVKAEGRYGNTFSLIQQSQSK